MTIDLVKNIDAVLPQTQCGLCGHGGCLPYAKALAENRDTIDHCPPGGKETLLQLAELTGQASSPYLEKMTKIAKPNQVVKIDEAICIGCTKCIQACPVDAIVGSAKQMHTVIASECTGCELCIAPCPVDCIEIVRTEPLSFEQTPKIIRDLRRSRYEQHQSRKVEKKAKAIEANLSRYQQNTATRKSFIQAAIERMNKKTRNN